MWIPFAVAAVLISPVLAHSGPDVLCVYPLSGVYTPLQRVLFYVLLVFGVLGRRQRWLVAGALASAMTYGGAAAIHAVLLVTRARSSMIDLDVYGIFAVTSTGIMLTAPLLSWSTTLQSAEREVRTLISLWALLITLGAILATAMIYINGSVEGPACVSSEEDISSAISVLRNQSASCVYVCLPEEHPLLRAPGDIRAWENRLDRPHDITGVFIPTIAGSIPSAIITWVWIIRRGRVEYLRPPVAFTRFELGWIGEWLFERRREPVSLVRLMRMRFSDRARHPRLLLIYRYYFVLGSFGVFMVNTVLNEVRFRSLPMNEMPFEVGQWSPWVGVALVVLAQVLSHLMRKSWREDRQRDDEEEMQIWDGRKGEGELRTSTFCSEGSKFRRNSW